MSNLAEAIETLEAAGGLSADGLYKAITVATGLIPYDLQAPARNLYPVYTPLLAEVPRVPGGSDATHWKSIYAISGSGWDSMGWVAEGQRTAQMSYSVKDKSASYKTIGEEDGASFEAINAGAGFEDIQGRMIMRLLQKGLLKEETALLGGNNSVVLTPGTVTVTTASTGGTVVAGTYHVAVVALTFEGYQNWLATGASIVTGLPVTKHITGMDGATYDLGGGSSAASGIVAGSAITGTGVISASVPAIPGAVAYGWYIDDGASGGKLLQAVTTINSYTTTVTPTGTGQNLTAITGDHSTNTLAYDGLIYAAVASYNGATEPSSAKPYINMLATGTAGTGTKLTASSRGSINEIDAAMLDMYQRSQTSITALYVNAQQLKDITDKVLNSSTGGGAPLVRFNMDQAGNLRVTAGNVVGDYFNPYTNDGGRTIPIKIHPRIPPGLIFGWTKDLPPQFQSNETPNTVEMKVRKDWYQLDWPITSRSRNTGVYVEEVPAIYAPFAFMMIGNIAQG